MRIARGVAALALLACQPATTRPSFTPLPEADVVEVRLAPAEATRLLAERLRADSLPVGRVDLRDGFIESRWFDSSSGQASRRDPLGTRHVRVRAWADPGRPGFTLLTAETVYRPFADPSLPPRELEHEVTREHPVAVKVRSALDSMVKRYGGPPIAEPTQPRARPAEEQETESGE
jgi:hypothetical protein